MTFSHSQTRSYLGYTGTKPLLLRTNSASILVQCCKLLDKISCLIGNVQNAFCTLYAFRAHTCRHYRRTETHCFDHLALDARTISQRNNRNSAVLIIFLQFFIRDKAFNQEDFRFASCSTSSGGLEPRIYTRISGSFFTNAGIISFASHFTASTFGRWPKPPMNIRSFRLSK